MTCSFPTKRRVACGSAVRVGHLRQASKLTSAEFVPNCPSLNRHFFTFYVRIGARELLSCAKSSRAPILVRAYPCEQGFCDSLSRCSAYVNCLLRERAYTCAKIQCGGPLLWGIGGPISHHVALCVTGTELLVVELGQSICACVHAGDMYATPELLAPRLAPPCPALGAR